MPKQKDKISENNIKLFKVSEKFEIGDLLINPFQFHTMPQTLADLIFVAIKRN